MTLARYLSGLAAACLFSLTVAAAPAPATDSATGGEESGVWKKHDYTLTYAGFTTLYSCEGLRSKLELLLKLGGARDDLKVRASCAGPNNGPSRMTTAYLTYYTLVPGGAATPVAGKAADAPTEPGVGTWRPVKIATNTPREIEGGDCELIEQFIREIVPTLTTRNVEQRMTCFPHQVTLGGISLKFEALGPVPKAPKAATGGKSPQ
jgi:hypothetical protein